jgi:glycosyltransferase involved in cell wall biosynthesis
MLNHNKNVGFAHARGQWLLSVDADEELSQQLIKEIRELIRCDPPIAGAWLPRKHIILGQTLQYGPWGEDQQLRLFRRGMGRFACRDIHEILELDGVAQALVAPLLHHRPVALAAYRRRVLHYSRVRAKRYLAERRTLQPHKLCLGPARIMFDALVLQGGVYDGPIALYLATMLGLESFCDHLYHWSWTVCGPPRTRQ